MAESGEIILLQLDNESAAILKHSISTLPDSVFEEKKNEEDFFHHLKTQSTNIKIVIIGPASKNPIQTAQKIHTVNVDIRIIILSAESEEAQLKRSIQFSPYLGDYVTVSSLKDSKIVAHELPEELKLVKQRQNYRKVISGSISDIEKQEKNLPKLQHVYLDRLIDNAPIGIITMDPSGVILSWNRTADDILGVKEEQSIGSNLRMIFPEKNYSELYQFLEETKESQGQPQTISIYRLYRGNDQWLEITGTAVTGRFDQSGFLLTVQDITPRKLIERDLKLSEEQFRTFAEAMPQMAFIADANGEIIYFNQRFFNYTGLGREVTGSGWKNYPIHHPDDLQRTIDTWAEAIRTGKDYEIEYRLRRYDGIYRWHLGRAVPVRDDKAKIIQWLGTNTDIEDQKENAQKLERALRARDEFLSIASHELNTPLSSMKLQVQMFQRNIKHQKENAYSPENVNKFIGQTDRQVVRLIRLVEDMLDIARIRTGKLTIKKENVEVCELLNDVIERLKPMISENKIQLQINCSERIEGSLDKLRIEQVINNLLTNAVRYGDHKPVLVTLSRVNDKICLTVRDEGIGISREALGRIFNRFERQVTANEIAGLGLGLFITREIVEAHKGSIWAESPGLGQGSTFHVELPISSPDEDR